MKTIKLREYVKKAGSQEKAAQLIGVTQKTVNRWLRKLEEPKGLSVHRLTELGIEVG